jgi:hypothetical protein
MKRNVVIITLTLNEALALSHAVDNSTSSPDCMEAIFQKKSERNSAYSAHQKLDDAIRAVNGFLQRST